MSKFTDMTQKERRFVSSLAGVDKNGQHATVYSIYHYGCVVGERIHRIVDYRWASERHLDIPFNIYGFPVYINAIPYGVLMRIVKPQMNVPKGEGMMEINKFAESADDWCARLRESVRQSRIQRNADPDTGLSSKAHPSIVRQMAKLRVIINHPSSEEWMVTNAKEAMDRLVHKAEQLMRKHAVH
jgi:hypothetical protein